MSEKTQETGEKQGFRNKPRKRKKPLRDAMAENAAKRKTKVIPYTTEEAEKVGGKKVHIWFNCEDLTALEELQGRRELSTPSAAVKEAVRFRLEHLSFTSEKARELAREMRRWGVTLKMIEKALEEEKR